jgi:hypothetical protein
VRLALVQASIRPVTYGICAEIPLPSIPSPCNKSAQEPSPTLPLHLHFHMLISVLRIPRHIKLVHLTYRNMSGGLSYAAAVSTPNSTMRQPQIQSRTCSDPDMRASFDSPQANQAQTKPQRPGAGIRAKTSFRGWTSSKKDREAENHERGAVQEVQHGFVPRVEHGFG